MKTLISGNEACAIGAKLCRPKVIPVYPITPSTHTAEKISELIANGELDAEMIKVESEHSALSACIGAQVCGVRTFTVTASQGLALMHEVLFNASGLRLPIVMGVANRALSAPINIWGDQSDALAERDSSWLQFYCESAQEILDTVIQAYKISENHDVLLPSMVCFDGFTLSHVSEPVDVPEQSEVDEFLGDYIPYYKFDIENPKTIGALAFPDTFMEFKKQQEDAMRKAKETIKIVNKEFSKKFGRSYGDGLIDAYNMEDAEKCLIALGSLCSTAKVVVDNLREKVGIVRVRSFRPFPSNELRDICSGVKAIAVIDRAFSYGHAGVLYNEVKSALYDLKERPKISNFVIGLGGRDVRKEDIEFSIKNADKNEIFWVNTKE
ncbi:MAG: pyruvate ferredoxin oxidoreductase [Candidatus Parvarchaeota archaeon]|nr:pyruvate ferredoxin oxidoreductase [Candidatus Jingweiarchaeum tengchongense]MCW1298007.1 pyruvate ferredoxin oxidoreductase [Candidatus Jingweiarchaeum tengchongense]MCW1300192.1 pyruvate ferredoxin oxidoreductase [Candidatus Jingweiarchaeum tengchongense]MCW1304402.1 pyruvate ferredoxin oxidoreductase [Candidatus Jingweiarchaeum tengchongense]MCW1305953.1 pyruvate ferredoxin oxidoreductase [Candidatus Jingweiarchaeum tengchongense]